MVGIEASTREGNPRRRNNQCERLGRVAEHFTRTLGHNCRALHETSPPLEPVDATSADVFSVLSASSSNPRASIVRPIPPPFLHRNFLPFVANRVFHCRSNLQFFLSFLFLFSLFSLPENETRVWRRNLQISPAQKFRPLFVRQRKFVRRINVCTTCISCNAINPPLLNGVIN